MPPAHDVNPVLQVAACVGILVVVLVAAVLADWRDRGRPCP